jgi:hypothetical protein
MICNLYIVISATDPLRSRLADTNPDATELLTETQLWSAPYADRSNWTTSSITTAVKLLFLANLHQEYRNQEEFRGFLGRLRITEESFDTWWKATPLQVEENFQDVGSRINTAILSEIDKTGIHAVDELMAWLLRKNGK